MEVVIMRGLPGAGKDYWIDRVLREQVQPFGVIRVSADDYRYKDGVYVFDPKDGAHEKCLRRYLDEVRNHVSYRSSDKGMVLVNNTNTTAWEIAPYYATALAYRLPCKIVRIECDPVVACRRNIHGVPPSTIFAMYRNLLTERLPGHWKEEIVLPMTEAYNPSLPKAVDSPLPRS